MNMLENFKLKNSHYKTIYIEMNSDFQNEFTRKINEGYSQGYRFVELIRLGGNESMIVLERKRLQEKSSILSKSF